MSTAEDKELMEKIDKLSGQINRHKAQRGGFSSDPHYPPRGAYHRTAPYPHGGYRGGRGRGAPTYRNKTLVLNGQPRTTNSASEDNEPNEPNAGSWVSKTDRHLQLINTSVFEKETQQRANAMEQTRRQNQLQTDHQEQAQVMNTMRQSGGDAIVTPTSASASASGYRITLNGVRFHVVHNGSKLVKAPDDLNPPSATPKATTISGVLFHRTKNGNLVRHGIVKAHRSTGRVKKVNEPCKAFSWTGTCPKGPTCRYIHDVTKTAICKEWLQRGDCARGDSCDLSHEITEQRTPLCLHYAKGSCNNPNCSYVHAEHAQTDPVCRAFGIYGYCDEGATCPNRHVLECPDFSNTGVCKLKGCRRPHIERASVLRRKASMRGSSEEMGDLSSDEDVAADSDDVDSDEVEEFIGKDDDDLDFAQQQDFIGFR